MSGLSSISTCRGCFSPHDLRWFGVTPGERRRTWAKFHEECEKCGLAACRTCDKHSVFKSKIRRESGRPLSQAAKSALRAGKSRNSAGFCSAQRCFRSLSSWPLRSRRRYSHFHPTSNPKSDRLLGAQIQEARVRREVVRPPAAVSWDQ